MQLIYNTNASLNGYDKYGTYLRTYLLPDNCVDYESKATFNCSGMFNPPNFFRAPARHQTKLAAALKDSGALPTSGSAQEGHAKPQGQPSCGQRSAADRPDHAGAGHDQPAAALDVHRRRGWHDVDDGRREHDDRRHRFAAPRPGATARLHAQALRQGWQGGPVRPLRVPARPMNRDGKRQKTVVNPTLIGAVTLLVGLIAVFLSYNANNGLPFVATYDLKAQVPNADALVRGNEVRIGGVRVGRVNSVTPETLDSGKEISVVDMSLETGVDPLPADSQLLIRPRCALALKYLEIKPGHSKDGIPDGGTIPLTAAKIKPVDLDNLFNTFTPRTRSGIEGNLRRLRRRPRRSRPRPQRRLRQPPAAGPLGRAGPANPGVTASTNLEGFFVALAAHGQ